MGNKIKIILAGICILLIVGVGITAYINKESLFMNEVEITYPDGCVEKYINTEMISKECIEGRLLMEEQKDSVEKNYNKYVGELELPDYT